MRKGVSPLIAYLLYAGVGLLVVSILATVGTATVNEMRDTAAIEQVQSDFSALSGLIDSVAASAEDTQMTMNLNVRRGSVRYENQSVLYEIQTPAQIIATGTRQTFGDVSMIANAGTSLVEDTYNGESCYRIENEHLETCIKQVDQATEMPLSDLVLYLRQKETDTMIEPDIDTVLDGTPATASGYVKTAITEQSRALGTGRVYVYVKPTDTDNPGYQLHIDLRTGADFLIMSVQ